MPVVSVITPCYKAAAYVGRTVESVQAQTMADWEHVVVDDGSPDDGAAVVQTYADVDPRVRLIRQPNGHACNARNNGARAASPDSLYFLFLDADDTLEPNALETMTHHLNAHPEVGVAYCAYRKMDGDDNLLDLDDGTGVSRRFVPAGLGIRALPPGQFETPFVTLMSYYDAIPSVTMYRRTIYEVSGGWDESLRSGFEDKDIVLSCAILAPVHHLSLPLTRYRRHETNTSNGSLISGLKQVDRKWREGAGLTAAQRRMAREALAFDARLSAWMGRSGAWTQIRAGQWRPGLRTAWQSGKKTVLFALRTLELMKLRRHL